MTAAAAPGTERRHWCHAWRVMRPYVNATLILAILLVGMSMWLVSTARSFVDDSLADVKLGLIQEADKNIGALLAEYRAGVAQFETLRLQISGLVDNPSTLIDPRTRSEIEALKKDADRIGIGLDRIASGHLELSQATLESLAVTVVRAYGRVRGCRLEEGASTREPHKHTDRAS